MKSHRSFRAVTLCDACIGVHACGYSYGLHLLLQCFHGIEVQTLRELFSRVGRS